VNKFNPNLGVTAILWCDHFKISKSLLCLRL